MFKKILVATDGSDHARKAVSTAASLAARLGAELTIVNALSGHEMPEPMARMAEVEHLIGPPKKEALGGLLRATDLGAERRARLAQVVSDLILAQAASLAEEAGMAKVAKVSLDMPAAEAILERAREAGADLIVLGTRGLGRVKGTMLGSVSQKVVQHAACACLTIK